MSKVYTFYTIQLVFDATLIVKDVNKSCLMIPLVGEKHQLCHKVKPRSLLSVTDHTTFVYKYSDNLATLALSLTEN